MQERIQTSKPHVMRNRGLQQPSPLSHVPKSSTLPSELRPQPQVRRRHCPRARHCSLELRPMAPPLPNPRSPEEEAAPLVSKGARYEPRRWSPRPTSAPAPSGVLSSASSTRSRAATSKREEETTCKPACHAHGGIATWKLGGFERPHVEWSGSRENRQRREESYERGHRYSPRVLQEGVGAVEREIMLTALI
jgi:hypothetical protein